MEWSTPIRAEMFSDPATMEWRTIRSWGSFTDLFEDAVRIEGVTYCESPELLLELLESEEYACEELELLIGDRDDYRSDIDDVAIARRLADQYKAGNLTVYLKNRKIGHSKLYRLVSAEGEVTLLTGSANLSHNSWRNQTNSLVIFRTEANATFDQRFQEWLQDHWESYGDEVFLADLVERLESIDVEEEREQYLELWVQKQTDAPTDRGAIHSQLSEELETVANEVAIEAGLVEDGELDADEEAIVPESGEGTVVDPEDVEHQGPFTAADTGDVQIKLSTQQFEPDGYLDQFSSHVRPRGAKASADHLAVPIETYTRYVEETYDQHHLWIDEGAELVHLAAGGQQRILTAREEPTPNELDAALSNIEAYCETVERWGRTNHAEGVMAHMFEGVLFGLWAPFINLYARGFYGRPTLDKLLPYLFIFGGSDAGKDQFTKFVLQLISDGLAEVGLDGDDFTKRRVRALREIDTAFPLVVSDVTKQKVETDPLRNFWEPWNPDHDISYPAIIFTSNDSRPEEWFRNRSKMLFFDVVFPSKPADEGFNEAQDDLEEILNVRNPIFHYVSREMLAEGPYEDPSGTIDDVRDTVRNFYDRADRRVPSYFPEEPAEQLYDFGRRQWQSIYRRGDITFSSREEDGHLIAEFDLESWEVYQYQKILPKQTRSEKQGRKILIKEPEFFIDWFGVDPRNKSIVDRVLRRQPRIR